MAPIDLPGMLQRLLSYMLHQLNSAKHEAAAFKEY